MNFQNTFESMQKSIEENPLDFVVKLAIPGAGLLEAMAGEENKNAKNLNWLVGMPEDWKWTDSLGIPRDYHWTDSFGNGGNLGFGNQGGGWFSNMFGGNTGGFGGYGDSPYSGGNIISSLGGQVNSLGNDMSSTSSWTQQDEDDYASDIGVSDWG